MINATGYQQYSSESKPKFLSSVGKGVATELKSLIPIYNLYMVGDEFCKIESSKETLENLKAGTDEYEEKNCFQKIIKGLGKAVVSLVPIVGTYSLGKAKNEKENLKKEIAGEETTKCGVFKNFFTGLGERIKLLIPFYNVYYVGKESLEATNIQNDVNTIYADAMSTKNKNDTSEFGAELSGTLSRISSYIESGLIDEKNMEKIKNLSAQLDAINNDSTLSDSKRTDLLIGINDELCKLMENM